MTQETQEAHPLTAEMRSRAEAIRIAGEVLQGSEPSKSPFTIRGTNPGEPYEIINMAEYIVSGVTYAESAAFRERMQNPEVHVLSLSDIFGGLLNSMATKVGDDGGEDDADEFEMPSNEVIHDLLSLVSSEIDPSYAWNLSAIEDWSTDTRRKVVEWARAVHLRASDNDVDVPDRPGVLGGDYLAFD